VLGNKQQKWKTGKEDDEMRCVCRVGSKMPWPQPSRSVGKPLRKRRIVQKWKIYTIAAQPSILSALSKCPGSYLLRIDDRSRCTFVRRHKLKALVGALSLDVTRLLALVASSFGRSLGWAVAREMANFTTVVALLALGAIT